MSASSYQPALNRELLDRSPVMAPTPLQSKRRLQTAVSTCKVMMQERLASEVDRLQDGSRSVSRERHPDIDADLTRLRKVLPVTQQCSCCRVDCLTVSRCAELTRRYRIRAAVNGQPRPICSISQGTHGLQELDDCITKLAEAEAAKADALEQAELLHQTSEVQPLGAVAYTPLSCTGRASAAR